MTIKIVTYNVLCSALSGKNVFPEATDEQLNPEIRLHKITHFFEEWIKDNTIICLQELSRTWYCELVNFFAERDYVLVYMSYGFNLNDYMGVAIAYPKSLKSTKIDAVSTNSFVKPIKKSPKNFMFLLNILFGNLMEIFYYLLNIKIKAKQLSTQELISKNDNIFLMIEFENFAVGTYHMPLWIDYRKSSTSVIAQKIIETSKNFTNKPFILTGDFNSLPKDLAIETFKQNKLKFIQINNKISFTNEMITCFPRLSSTFDGKNINNFKGQIDYIFYNETQFLCESIITYTKNKELINTPNDLDPSDHLPVVGNFKIKIEK